MPRADLDQRTRRFFSQLADYRIDMWDADGANIIDHLAGVEDLQFAKAAYLAACKRWPGIPITLRQRTQVIEDNRRTRLG
jgi:hypothetical protein